MERKPPPRPKQVRLGREKASHKKLTPHQRAIEKKRAIFRELQSSGVRLDFDPDTYDGGNTEKQYFDRLSNDEWAVVWKRISHASSEPALIDEARIRELVDDAAMSSGWFAEYGGEARYWSRAQLKQYANEKHRFLKKLQTFRHEIVVFLGPPSEDYPEFYDPWERYRPVVPVLDRLAAQLEHEIGEYKREVSTATDPPNAAKPELDLWRARLLLAWQNECHLRIENTKHLRGFLIAALEPYMPRAELTDRMAKHFIKRWLSGKVEMPVGFSYLDLRGDK
jgi:hypothetical protein